MSHQIVGCKTQQHVASQLRPTDEATLAHAGHGLEPAKGLFDTLAPLERGPIASVARGTPIYVRALALGRHVRRDPEPAAGTDELLTVVALVGRHRVAAPAVATDHFERGLALGPPMRKRGLDHYEQPVALFH